MLMFHSKNCAILIYIGISIYALWNIIRLYEQKVRIESEAIKHSKLKQTSISYKFCGQFYVPGVK